MFLYYAVKIIKEIKKLAINQKEVQIRFQATAGNSPCLKSCLHAEHFDSPKPEACSPFNINSNLPGHDDMCAGFWDGFAAKA